MGSTKERMMVWKEEEREEEGKKEKESIVRTLQINSGNTQALPLLLCFRNLYQFFLSQALQQTPRTFEKSAYQSFSSTVTGQTKAAAEQSLHGSIF